MQEKPPLQAPGVYTTLPTSILRIDIGVLKGKRKAANFAFAWREAHCTDTGKKLRFQNRFIKA